MRRRIKQIRKQAGLTQDAFGKIIGLSQKSVANIETGATSITPRNVDIICREFNVNKNWLETGEGEVFNAPKEQTFLDLLAEEKGLNSREIALLQSIIDLPSSVRGAVIDWALDLARRVGEETPEDKELREIEEEQRRLDERRAQLTTGEKSLNVAG